MRRLGSTRSEPVDVWIVAATSEDLHGGDAGAPLPRGPLSPPRRPDAPPAAAPRAGRRHRPARRALPRARRARTTGSTPRTLAPDARAALLAYPWPGNVRELANTMERVALLSDAGVVAAEALALPSRAGAAAGAPARVPSDPPGSAADERQALLDSEARSERTAAPRGPHRDPLEHRPRRRPARASPGTRSATAWRSTASPPARPGRARPTDAGSTAGADRAGAGRAASPRLSPAAPASVRWEPRRVTFLRARLLSPAGSVAPTEASRALDAIVDKVRSFGGRVDELSATGLVAAFGLEPLEDAQRHAASAAVAIQKVAERARGEDPARPGRHPGASHGGAARRGPWRPDGHRRGRQAPGARAPGGARRARRSRTRRRQRADGGVPHAALRAGAGRLARGGIGPHLPADRLSRGRARAHGFRGTRGGAPVPPGALRAGPGRAGAGRLHRGRSRDREVPPAPGAPGPGRRGRDVGGGTGRAVRADDPVPSADRPPAARLPHRRRGPRGGHRGEDRAGRRGAGAGSPARAALRAPPPVRRSRRPGDPPDGREAAASRDLRRHARALRAPGVAPPAGGRLGGPPLDGPGDGGVHRRAGGRRSPSSRCSWC